MFSFFTWEVNCPRPKEVEKNTKLFPLILFHYFFHTTPKPPPKKRDGRIGDMEWKKFLLLF